MAFLPSRRARRYLRSLDAPLRWLWRRTPRPPLPRRTLTPRRAPGTPPAFGPIGRPPELVVRSRRAREVWVITLSGALDLRTRAHLVEALEDALGDDAEQIVLDLTALDSIDRAGLDAVLVAHLRAADQLTALLIVPGPPRVQRVFDGIQGPFVYAARHVPRPARHARPRARRTFRAGTRPDRARRSG